MADKCGPKAELSSNHWGGVLMTALIFIHGISVRAPGYQEAFGQVESALARLAKDHGLVATPRRCLWGDQFGAVLKAGGLSIPHYMQTKGTSDASAVEDESDPWPRLLDDPFLELGILALRPKPAPTGKFDPTGAQTPAEKEAKAAADRFDAAVEKLSQSPDSLTLQAAKSVKLFERYGIPPSAFQAAAKEVTRDRAYREARQASADDLGPLGGALTRAVVAQAALASQSQAALLAVVVSRDDWDALAREVASELALVTEKGPVLEWLKRGLAVLGTRHFQTRRGRYTDILVPFVGDVLVYQGHGEPIRGLVRDRITEEKGAPVVLLAHSLGGIACVDLLAKQRFPEVNLLVTVGSQAPLLYEMDALQNLRFGAPLPDHFPLWLNIYDQRDFLSYKAAKVFKDDPRITDVRIDNRQPFPQAHSAYWTNWETWETLRARWPVSSPQPPRHP
jgi:hypothetical protein